MIPADQVHGNPARFAYSKTSSTKAGSCADGTLPETRSAFKARAFDVAVDIGLFTSLVLSTFARPTAVLSIVPRVLSPFIYCAEVPVVMVGSFPLSAVAVAFDIGFSKSVVLSTFDNPTSDLERTTAQVLEFTLDTQAVHPPQPLVVELFI